VNETQSFEPVLCSLKILYRLFRSYEHGQKCHFFALTEQITEMIIKGLKHDYSKVISESLHVANAFLSALKDVNTLVIYKQFSKEALTLFELIFEKLSKTDID
jgi:hypothetical protein